MTDLLAHGCALVFDGRTLHKDAVLLTRDGVVEGICPHKKVPAGYQLDAHGDGILSPGFVDLQVNGGGGLMLGEAASVADIARICAAHLALGTTALTPTLITDTPEVTRKIVDLAVAAWEQGVPGFHGLHLEGPHLFAGKKGAHDASLIRPLTEADMALYREAAAKLPSLMITLAPEMVPVEQIAQLSAAGIHVSLGHSNASCEAGRKAVEAGARCVTHLFNAMSPLQHRDPGLVGAALELGALNAGLIADGVHVDPVALKIALRAKTGPGQIFLVTDAMSQTGTDVERFELGGREIFRKDGRLTLEDGTLAGADVDLPASIRFVTKAAGLSLETALKMATSIPADVIGRPLGRLETGRAADVVHLGPDMSVKTVWLGGVPQSLPA